MSLLRSRVGESAANPGSGAITLGGALDGYRTFAAAGVAVGQEVLVLIYQSATKWQLGFATRSGTSTLTRGTVIASTNAGANVTFDGAVNVYVAAAAESGGPLIGMALSATTTGSATAYVAAFYPPMPAWKAGAIFVLTFDEANSGTTPTLEVDGLTAKTLVDRVGGALAVGALATGATHLCQYDGTNVRVLTIFPAASTTVQGAVELATADEALIATDTARAVTPAGLAGHVGAGSDIASGSSIALGSGNRFKITGTTNIAAITEGATPRLNGVRVSLYFAATLTLVHNSTDLELQGNADRITSAGDEIVLAKKATGQWKEVGWHPKTAPTAPTGVLVKRGYYETGAHSQPAAVATPADNTIPQKSEGATFLTLAYTPLASGNLLRIASVAYLAPPAGGVEDDPVIAFLTQEISGAEANDAIAVGSIHIQDTETVPSPVELGCEIAAPGTDAITFRLKAGTPNGAQIGINGVGGSALFGGKMKSWIEILEYTA